MSRSRRKRRILTRWVTAGRQSTELIHPKGQRNVRTVLSKTLNERTKIREGNRARSVTKLDCISLKRVSDAAHGNAKARTDLFALMPPLATCKHPRSRNFRTP